MKNLFFYFVVLILVASCTKEPKNYVTFSGKIENPDPINDTLTLLRLGNKGDTYYKKKIKLKLDGTFKDTLMITLPRNFILFYSHSASDLFLKPGYDLNFTTDAKDKETFKDNLKFTGVGAESNNFGKIKDIYRTNFFKASNYELTEEKFSEKLDSLIKDYSEKLDNYSKKGVDKAFISLEKKGFIDSKSHALKSYKKNKEENALFGTMIGKPSPSFSNFENAKGGKASLSDLKGKYVYIDLWATWCGPCKAEFPSLKKLEEEFHDKNITFLSISVDDGLGFKGDKEAAKKAWKKVVLDEELGGVQLISDNGTKSDFFKKYKLTGIPRFILLDPEGKVINPQAPKPSEPNTKSYLESLIK